MTSDAVGGMAGLRGAPGQGGRGNGVAEGVFQDGLKPASRFWWCWVHCERV
jgi:hypothetical protein